MIAQVLALSFAAAAQAPPAAVSPAPAWYDRGVVLREAGDWRGALEVWREGRDSLEAAGRHDPRLGIAYAELVAERRAAEEYEAASQMYAWGFSGAEYEPYRAEVQAEARRIIPLLTEEDSARFQAMIDDDNAEILREIRLLWMTKDPTPDTPLNERLMEHWERVAYAREHFTRGRYSPYGTDDRGTVYVKFGAPDKRTSGSLGAREDEMRIWITDPLMRERVRRYDANPQFELWAYDRLNPLEFVYFLFGNERGTGPFKLVRSPNDLIPTAAWSAASRRTMPGSIKAAYFLQLFYYADLAIMGGPYGKRFGELESLWGMWESRGRMRGGAARPPPEGDLEAYDQRYVLEDRYHRTDRPLTPDYSEFDDGSRAVELIVEPIRVLGTNDEPLLYVVALSGPKARLSSRTGRIRRRDIIAADPDYAALHRLVIRDTEFREVGRVEERVTAAEGDMSVFILNHVPERLIYSLTVDVERDADEARLERSELPARSNFEADPPLPTSPDELVMSDVVPGVAPGPDESFGGLPFPVIPSRTIWTDDPLRLYVELYHLRQRDDGVARYRYDFRIAPGRPDEPAPEDPVTLSMDLEARAPTARDVFDIDISALPPGPATVSVRATDLLTGRSVQRTEAISILR